MSNMEFLSRNLLGTSTSIAVGTGGSGSATTLYLIDRKKNSFRGTAATTNTIHFDVNDTIDRIVLQKCNFTDFSITHSGTAFSLSSASGFTTTATTATSSWSASGLSSSGSLYLKIPTTTVATVTVTINTTTSAGVQTLQEAWFLRRTYTLDTNPEAGNYNPRLDRKKFIHDLAPGGKGQYVLDNFWDATIALEFVPQTERDALLDIQTGTDAFVFVEFPTTTSWETFGAQIFETIWTNDFNFNYSDNNLSAGFSGEIQLDETSK